MGWVGRTFEFRWFERQSSDGDLEGVKEVETDDEIVTGVSNFSCDAENLGTVKEFKTSGETEASLSTKSSMGFSFDGREGDLKLIGDFLVQNRDVGTRIDESLTGKTIDLDRREEQ